MSLSVCDLPRALVLGLGLAALLAACRAAPLPEGNAEVSTLNQPAPSGATLLGPGDVLRVSVYGHPELSTPTQAPPHGTRVDADGWLSLPLIDPIQVDGENLAQTREAITTALARFVQDPRVDLSLVEQSARRVYLYGEVAQPGAYVLDRPLNVYQALSLGGGFTRQADREKIVLLRGPAENLEVHVIDGETPQGDGLAALRPDDFLFVRRSGAGRFSDEMLPILSGISSSLAAAATVLLVEERLD